jgi:glycyl-tRNA synthetase alpha chain
MDGMEITQFTYFQQAGGIDLQPVSAEITYGLERIAMFLNKLDSVYDVMWNDTLSYGQVRRRDEVEMSKYAFEVADAELAQWMLDRHEREAKRCLDAGLVIPATRRRSSARTSSTSSTRGAPVSATDRVGIIRRIPRSRLRVRAGLRRGPGRAAVALSEPEPAAV